MPYIQVNMSNKLDESGKEALKAALGELIALIPGKSESVTMICIHDDSTIYFGGEKKEKVAYINVKLFKDSSFEAKAAFTEKVFQFFEKEFGIMGENLFMNFDAYQSWASRGALKE